MQVQKIGHVVAELHAVCVALLSAWTGHSRSLSLSQQRACMLQGRMVLLLGPPGGGKTTLLNALAGKLRSGGGLRVWGGGYP